MQGGVILLSAIAVFSAQANMPAKPASNRDYTGIEERNVFGLNAPSAPAQYEQPAQQKLPKVALNGITTILGSKQALLKVAPVNMKPGDQPESLILKEGQRQGPVEVVQINEKKGTVRLVNSGTPMTITFEEVPPVQAGTTAVQGTNPTAGSPIQAGANTTPRAWTTNSMLAANPTAPIPTGLRQFPIRTPRLPGDTAATNAPPPLPGSTGPQQLTPEERTVLLQLEEQLNKEKNQLQHPPPPAGNTQQYMYQQ